MAHFAKLDSNNQVIDIQKVNDEVILENGIENELLGQTFLRNLFNEPNAIWKQTSYNTYRGTHKNNKTPLRENYAVVGGTYDVDRNAFVPPKPFNNWIYNNETYVWKAPIDKPNLTEEQQQQNDARTHFWRYKWNDDTIAWDLINTLQ